MTKIFFYYQFLNMTRIRYKLILRHNLVEKSKNRKRKTHKKRKAKELVTKKTIDHYHISWYTVGNV